jgi:hypothetical protein
MSFHRFACRPLTYHIFRVIFTSQPLFDRLYHHPSTLSDNLFIHHQSIRLAARCTLADGSFRALDGGEGLRVGGVGV